jgi:hypothetical protein
MPLIGATLIAAEIHMGYPGVRAWLPYVLLIPLTALLIWRFSSSKVVVADGELHLGDAHLPLNYVGEIDVVEEASAKRRALGPELNPAAFVLHRSWVKAVLRVEVTDERDPTPYWVISTRRPERLEAVLRGE